MGVKLLIAVLKIRSIKSSAKPRSSYFSPFVHKMLCCNVPNIFVCSRERPLVYNLFSIFCSVSFLRSRRNCHADMLRKPHSECVMILCFFKKKLYSALFMTHSKIFDTTGTMNRGL